MTLETGNSKLETDMEIVNRIQRRYTHRCKRCMGSWETVLEAPKKCRVCGSALWNVKPVRAVGGGRPKGSGRGGPVSVVKGEVLEKVKTGGRQEVVKDEQGRRKKTIAGSGQSSSVADVRGSVFGRVVGVGATAPPKAAVIAALKGALGMTTLGEEVPEKIGWLEETSDVVEEGQSSEAGVFGADSGGADPVQGSEPGILPLSGRNPGGASAAPPVRGRAPGVVERSPVVTPVYESFAAQVKRYAQRIKDEYPETDPGRADEQAAMLVKNEWRQKALEAEGAGREAAPDYDTGSQEVRRGRRKR